MPCPTCGQPDYIQCNCNAEPYCEQCSEDNSCIQKVDAECVFYHRDGLKPSKLLCSGISNKTSIEDILEVFDGYLCQINTTQTPLTVIDSPTIDLTAWSTLKHTLQADVKISSASGNTIVIEDDGLYVPPFIDIDASGNTFISTADNGLTKIGSNIQLGGLLIHDTQINNDAYTFAIGNVFNYKLYGTYYSKENHIDFVGDAYSPTGFASSTEKFSSFCDGAIYNSAEIDNITKYSLGSYKATSTDGSIGYYLGVSADMTPPPPDVQQTSFVRASSNTVRVKATDFILQDIPNTKDDTVTNPQSNVLYTNAVGKTCSAPFLPPLRGSSVLDFPSTSANSSSILTIGVTGAKIGDNVVVNSNINIDNTSWSAYVSAADTVTVKFNNYSTGAIDPAQGIFTVTLFPFPIDIPDTPTIIPLTATADLGGTSKSVIVTLSSSIACDLDIPLLGIYDDGGTPTEFSTTVHIDASSLSGTTLNAAPGGGVITCLKPTVAGGNTIEYISTCGANTYDIIITLGTPC